MEKAVGAVTFCAHKRLPSTGPQGLVAWLCLLLTLGLLGFWSGGVQAQQASPVPASVAQSYLYVEPFLARVEVLVDAATVFRWANSGTEPPPTLDAAAQKALEETMRDKAGDWVRVSGKAGELAKTWLGASIIKGKPGATLPFEPGASLALGEAMVGLMWEFPTDAKPGSITLEWVGFQAFPPVTKLPLTVFYGTARSEKLAIASDQPAATWDAQYKLAELPPLAVVPPLQSVPIPWFKLAASGCLVVAGLLAWALFRKRPSPANRLALAGLSGALLGVVLGGAAWTGPAVGPVKDKDTAERIVTPLLRNVYRAFDHRAEGEIYDVLARSVEGELLRKLYLETIQALTLEGREGTRVTIQQFSAEILDVKTPPALQEGFVTDCQWTALGSVGHWGHTHQRINRYTASVTVAPADGAWKIVDLDVSEARRL